MNPEKPKFLAVQKRDDFYLWLEERLPPRLILLAVYLAAMPTATYSFLNDFPVAGVYQSLIAAIIYSFSAELDDLSTIRVANAVDNFEQQTGLNSPFKESAMFLPKRPNSDDLSGYRQRAIQAAACAFGILVPPVGVGWGIMKSYAFWHNERVRALHERKLTEYLNG